MPQMVGNAALLPTQMVLHSIYFSEFSYTDICRPGVHITVLFPANCHIFSDSCLWCRPTSFIN